MIRENPHGWIDTASVETLCGSFDFRGGYPTPDSARRLEDLLTLGRAVEVYLAQLPAISWSAVWSAVAHAGSGTPNQLVIWESRLDARTLMLTGNTETVYGLVSCDLGRDGPTVVEVPAGMLGGINDMWQHPLADIGPTGVDQGKGARLLLVPPRYRGAIPDGYEAVKCTNYHLSMGIRGFLVDGKPDAAVAAMKSTRIYPLAQAAAPPPMTFVNASEHPIDTLFSDTTQAFDALAELVDQEPVDAVQPRERFQLASIGIEKGKPFSPDARQRRLLADAARLGSAMARRNSFASTDSARMVYPDRCWEWAFVGGKSTWDAQGYVNVDRRAAFAYIAIGMSPAMVQKVVGQGSQYLWTARDSNGAFLDGGNDYHLRLPPHIPAKNFWSVVVYDALSRSLLQNGQPYPTVSQYTDPRVNDDGSVDVYFGPAAPRNGNGVQNWIRTLERRGWFTLLRFYGPTEPFFDQSWKPGDITRV